MNDVYLELLGDCNYSRFQYFESYRRTKVDLVEDDIRLLLKENSNFITYETPPGISSFKDVSEVHSRVFQNGFETSRSERESLRANVIYYKSDSTVTGYDDFTMKADQKIWYVIKAMRFDEKSFFSAILGFGPHWVYKSYN